MATVNTLSPEHSMATACTGVVGDYNCPQQVGNRVHVLLNAELCARAYGVPLLWHPNIENGLVRCRTHSRTRGRAFPLTSSATANDATAPIRPVRVRPVPHALAVRPEGGRTASVVQPRRVGLPLQQVAKLAQPRPRD